MKPLKDHVLLERIEKDLPKKGNLLLVNESKKYEYSVIGIGLAVTIDIKIGDKVLVDYGLNEIPNELNKSLFVVSENNIYLVL